MAQAAAVFSQRLGEFGIGVYLPVLHQLFGVSSRALDEGAPVGSGRVGPERAQSVLTPCNQLRQARYGLGCRCRSNRDAVGPSRQPIQLHLAIRDRDGRALEPLPRARHRERRGPVRAHEARSIGLVSEVVSHGQGLRRAVELAHALAAFPQTALRNDRQAVYEGLGLPLAEGLRVEARLGAGTVASGEAAAGADAFRKGAGRGGRW